MFPLYWFFLPLLLQRVDLQKHCVFSSVRNSLSPIGSRQAIDDFKVETCPFRVQQCQALLEGTNLMLYAINQTTLVKNSSGRDEIQLLMQGLSPPQPQFTTDPNSLPPAKSPQSGPGPSPLNRHSFPEAEDGIGQARIQKRKDTTGTLAGSTALPTIGINLSNLSSAPGPLDCHRLLAACHLLLVLLVYHRMLIPPVQHHACTTTWRRKREREQGQRSRERKEYSC